MDDKTMEQIVVMTGVTKVYMSKFDRIKKKINPNCEIKEIRAVDNLTLAVNKGEIFGLLGANGSGKTTIIKLLCGLIKPDFGSISVLGYNITSHPENVLGEVGAIVEAPSMFKDMTGLQNLEYFAILQGGIPHQRIVDILKLVGLENRMNSKFSTYSLGMQQRLGIAQAIMHNPKLLILDEPINGLDPDGIIQIRELLETLRSHYGTTIIISSHILSEMQALCDKVAIMVDGKIMAIKNMQEIESQRSDVTIAYIECDNPIKAFTLIKEMEGVEVKLDNNRVFIKFSGDLMGAINKKLVLADINISAINIKKHTLEDLYKELVK